MELRAVLALVGIGALGASAQAQPRTCRDALQWSGDVVLAEQVMASLAEGPLVDAPEDACADVQVEVGRERRGISVTLHDGSREISRTAPDIAIAGSWIESWLDVSAGGAADRAPPVQVEPAAPSPPRSEAEGRRPSDRERSEWARASARRRGGSGGALRSAPPESLTPDQSTVPFQVAVRTAGDLDHVAPLWAGGTADVSVGLGRYAWLGLTASAMASPEQEETVRFALRLSARTGWRQRFDAGLLRVGGGLGIVSASSRRVNADQTVQTDEEAGPYLEAMCAFDAALGDGPWALSFALAGRVHVPDDALEPLDPPGEMDADDPRPLPTIAVTFEAGISFDAGGPW